MLQHRRRPPRARLEWLPAVAEILGAKPPRHVSSWIARLMIGDHGVAMMTEARGASNAKAQRALGWSPSHPSWRDGFRTALQAPASPVGCAVVCWRYLRWF